MSVSTSINPSASHAPPLRDQSKASIKFADWAAPAATVVLFVLFLLTCAVHGDRSGASGADQKADLEQLFGP